MGAFGGRGVLLSRAHGGGVDLAVKSDGFALQVSGEQTDESPAVTVDVSRVRLLLEGSVDVLSGPAGVLTPSLQVGGRYDGGAAETGAGLEVGGGLSYAYPAWGLTLEAHGRLLLAHQDTDYEEWGAGGSLRLAPGAAGRGPALSLNTSWGDASSGVEQLWSQGAGGTVGHAPAAGSPPAGRLTAELSYGLEAADGNGMLSPYAGVALAAGGERSYRLGARFTLAQSLRLSLEGERRERPGHDGSAAARPHPRRYRTLVIRPASRRRRRTNNDIANYEGFYASVFYSYFAALGYEITLEESTVEESSSHGRLDMALRAGGQVYLFEFKVVELAPPGSALAQLQERDYAAKYRGGDEPIRMGGNRPCSEAAGLGEGQPIPMGGSRPSSEAAGLGEGQPMLALLPVARITNRPSRSARTSDSW